jgi:hypothetical protein
MGVCGVFKVLSIVFFGMCCIIGMACMIVYSQRRDQNGMLTPGNCVVLSTAVLPDTCYRWCNCDNNNQNCVSCAYTCYKGYVFTGVIGVIGIARLQPYTNDLYYNVVQFMAVVFPDNKQFPCFYSGTNSTGVFITLSSYDAYSAYIAGLVFLSIACLILVGFICFLAYYFILVPFMEYCNNYSRNKQIKEDARIKDIVKGATTTKIELTKSEKDNSSAPSIKNLNPTPPYNPDFM